MALKYYLYRTDFNNTIIDRSLTPFTLGANEGQIQADVLIPNAQALYLCKESGGAIVANDELTVKDFLYSPETIATQGDLDLLRVEFQSYTATTSGSSTTEIIFFTAQTTLQNTTATAFQTYLSLPINVANAGDYIINVVAHLGNSSARKTAICRFELDGVSLHSGSDLGVETNSTFPVTQAVRVKKALNNGIHTVSILFRAESGTAYISFGSIEIKKGTIVSI